jgi:CHASE2 domain
MSRSSLRPWASPLTQPHALREPEFDTIDARFAIRGTQPWWPFPRTYHARVIDELSRDGARVIAYDVQFTEQTTPRADNALITSVQRADRTSHSPGDDGGRRRRAHQHLRRRSHREAGGCVPRQRQPDPSL